MNDPDRWLASVTERAERALAKASVRRWEVAADVHESAAIEVQDGEVEVAERAIERSVGIRVLDGGIGFAGLTEPSDEALSEAVEAALREARSARPAAIDELASSRDTAGATTERFTDDRAAGSLRPLLTQLALELEAAALGTDPRIVRIRPARIEEERGWRRIKTSAGLDVTEASSRASAMAGVVAEDDEDTESAFGSGSAATAELLDVRAIGREPAEVAVSLLGAGSSRTGLVPIIFGFEAAAELIALLAGSLEADRLERGASFLAGALGRAVLSEALTLVDDPHDAALDGSAAFDGEGLATGRVVLIDRGIVRAVLDDRDTAARAGRAPNARAVRTSASHRPGPGAHNLELLPGEASLAGLYARAEGGVFVHEVSGTHTMNEVTGELSLGVTGWAIRGGGRAEPVRGLTVAGVLPAMLSRPVVVSRESKDLGPLRAPALLFEGLWVSSG